MSNQQQGDCLDAYPVFVLSQLRPRYRDRVDRRLAGTPKTLMVLSISFALAVHLNHGIAELKSLRKPTCMGFVGNGSVTTMCRKRHETTCSDVHTCMMGVFRGFRGSVWNCSYAGGAGTSFRTYWRVVDWLYVVMTSIINMQGPCTPSELGSLVVTRCHVSDHSVCDDLQDVFSEGGRNSAARKHIEHWNEDTARNVAFRHSHPHLPPQSPSDWGIPCRVVGPT
jgi:hypothetical protein